MKLINRNRLAERKLSLSRNLASTRFGRKTMATCITAVCAASMSVTEPVLAGGYDDPQYSMSGFYLGVLGQYTYADARFIWGDTTIFDQDSGNWGIGGIAGHGWTAGNFYFGGEIYADYANISNVLAQTVEPVSQLALNREVGAGANLLAGITGFDDRFLLYGLVGGGATNFAGSITVSGASLKGDIWYPVLSLGVGVDWAITPSLSVRVQGKHTFYYDVSDRIFPSNTSQSYNFDTTMVSVGLIWRPWN